MTRSIVRLSWIPAACLLGAGTGRLPAQVAPAAASQSIDASLVARHSAVVQGTLMGGLAVLDTKAAVTVDPAASISGDLVLPADKVLPTAAKKDHTLKVSPSSKTTIDNRGGSSTVKGAVQTTPDFKLPRVLVPTQPVKPQSLVVQGKTEAPSSFANIGDISVQKPGAAVVIPAGSYGDLAITQGTVTLGQAGANPPIRYEFRSLDVQPGGTLAVAGPVVVTLANGATVRGTAGQPDAPLWLDLRVAQGDVTVGGQGRLYAFLTVPAGLVTVSRGAALSGGTASDRLEIQSGATATVVAPDWSAKATDKTQPRFPHRALRLQAKVPELGANFRHSYSPGVTYINDVPCLMLAEGKRPLDHPLATFEQQRVFFEGWCTLFLDTGFDRATLASAGYSSDPIQRPPPVRNITLTTTQFAGALETVAHKGTTEANIEAIHYSPELLAAFEARVVATGLVARTKN